MIKYIDSIIISLFILTMILYFYNLLTEKYIKTDSNLETDGYLVLKNSKKSNVLNILPEGYQFLDYSYTIKGCTLSTFHRDVTSSKYVFNAKHPTYTYIIYYNSGPLLSVCPKSHKTTPFVFSNPIIIKGHDKTGILFDSDLLHAGAISDLNENRHLVQYKLVHKDDLTKFEHLNKIHKIEKAECNNINKHYQLLLRKISLIFPFVFNHLFTSYLQEDQKSHVGNFLLWIYGKKFYNK